MYGFSGYAWRGVLLKLLNGVGDYSEASYFDYDHDRATQLYWDPYFVEIMFSMENCHIGEWILCRIYIDTINT